MLTIHKKIGREKDEMKKITKKKMWVFALGQFGWAILGGIITNWLVYFYQPDQEVIGLGHKLYVSQGNVILGVVSIVGLQVDNFVGANNFIKVSAVPANESSLTPFREDIVEQDISNTFVSIREIAAGVTN